MVRLACEGAYMTKAEEDRNGITSHNCKILPLSNLNIYTLAQRLAGLVTASSTSRRWDTVGVREEVVKLLLALPIQGKADGSMLMGSRAALDQESLLLDDKVNGFL
jgi:hypothetical protein